MKISTLSFFLFLAFFSFNLDAVAQCTEENTVNTNTVGSTIMGQSIRPSCDGTIEDFTFRTTSNGGAILTVNVYEGKVCSGTSLATETIVNTVGENTFTFSNPASVSTGQDYTISITSSHTGYNLAAAGGYAEGGLIFSTNCQIFEENTWDMVFSCTIAPIAVDSVPTMGEWALITFGLIIMSVGVVTVRRREELIKVQTA